MSTSLAERLQGAGLRVTQQRLAVLAALGGHGHVTADELVVLAADARVSRQAAFVIVGDLTRAGLVRRLDAPGQSARYEIETGDNHHHALCDQCGRLVDVPCSGPIAPCLDPPSNIGMHIRQADVLYRGLCDGCRTSPQATTPPERVS